MRPWSAGRAMEPRPRRTDSGVVLAVVVALIAVLLASLFVTGAWSGGFMGSGTVAAWLISVLAVGVVVLAALQFFLALDDGLAPR